MDSGVFNSDQPRRTFPPLYQSSGDDAQDRLAFFHILERLKVYMSTSAIKDRVYNLALFLHRHRNVLDGLIIPNAESISDHMYRMAILAMCSTDAKLDISRCVMMALVHDLAEAHVGDIAPRENIPKADKKRLEAEAMQNFVHEMLHDSPPAKRMMDLWQEYEEGQTDEAKFVKDLDRFEMASQALEYEKAHSIQLQPFFDSSLPNIRHEEVKGWGEDLLRERHQEE